jgi:hypothetical protein
MKQKIIFYKQKDLTQNMKFKLRRELLGIKQKSNFSRYTYKVEGALDKIPNYRPVDSTIIIEENNLNIILDLINNLVIYWIK